MNRGEYCQRACGRKKRPQEVNKTYKKGHTVEKGNKTPTTSTSQSTAGVGDRREGSEKMRGYKDHRKKKNTHHRGSNWEKHGDFFKEQQRKKAERRVEG